MTNCNEGKNLTSLMSEIKKCSVEQLLDHLRTFIKDEDTLKILEENFSSSKCRQLIRCCCHQCRTIGVSGSKLPQTPAEQPSANYDSLYTEIRTKIIQMIGKLLCKRSITGSVLTAVLDECEILFLSYTDLLVNMITSQTDLKNLSANLKMDSPFEQLKTIEQQVASLKTYHHYVEPVEIPLSYRMDNRLDKDTGTYRPKRIYETFQYVPVIETLKLVISNKSILNLVLLEKGSKDERIMTSFVDGDNFKNHPFFSRYKNALRLQLYYDELEIVNPLGSKTGVHKLGAFYYTIQNLPPHMNSELSSIHVLLICTNEDVKKYGFKKILDPFMEDLKKLESDEGISINVEGTNFILRASIAAFCGDGLAVHDVYNFLGPSANKFCRMCMCSRQNLRNNVHEAPRRTKTLYDKHLKTLEKKNFLQETMTDTGIKGSCCLNESKYFHVTENLVFDPMHDFLCGVTPMVIKHVLHEFIIKKKILATSEFNARLQSFQYGFVEKVNQPSANFTANMLRQRGNTLSQKAMQTWCLIRVFPFLFYDKIPDGDPHMQLILLLLRIMELVFAPEIFKSQLPYLKRLISDFTETFAVLFPNTNLINKMHHFHHYWECILASGPMAQFNCMRYEAKHSELKIRAQNMCNFKNPPKTLIRAPQCTQSAKWGTSNVELVRVQIIKGHKITVQATQCKNHLFNLGLTNNDMITSTTKIKYNGVEFRLNLYVCLEPDYQRTDNLPLFGIIKEIIVINEKEVYFLTVLRECSRLDVNLNAFKIKESSNCNIYRFVRVDKLPHFKPFCSWNVPDSDRSYISLRHIIV